MINIVHYLLTVKLKLNQTTNTALFLRVASNIITCLEIFITKVALNGGVLACLL